MPHDLTQVMRRFGRPCRGQGHVFVCLVRQTAQQLLERGSPSAALAQAAPHGLQSALPLTERQRERVVSHLQAALEAHHDSSQPSRRLTQGKRLHHGKIGKASAATIAPILTGTSNCPAQCGRQPGIISEPTAGFLFATPLPRGHPIDASSVVPLLDKVQSTLARVKGQGKLAIHAVASDRGANDPVVRQTRHARGILPVGIPQTGEPLHPHPTPHAILDDLNGAGLNRTRTPHQGPLACACGQSRPVVERHMATLLARGAGPLRDKGPHGAALQWGMTVLAHNGATVVRIRQQRLSKRAQKFRRLLRLRCRNVNEFNASKN